MKTSQNSILKKTKISSREKYDLIYKMINELDENEKCNLIGDLIEDMELSLDQEMVIPLPIVKKGSNVVFEN